MLLRFCVYSPKVVISWDFGSKFFFEGLVPGRSPLCRAGRCGSGSCTVRNRAFAACGAYTGQYHKHILKI